MNQTYEGTIIGINPPSNKHKIQENVEEVKASGNHLSGKQPDYQPDNQNPEGPTDNGKPSEERRSIVKLWSEMTKLKKGLFIGGVFVTIIFAILFTLLIVTIRTKPRLAIRRQEALSTPNSNQLLRTYQVQGVKPNIFSPGKSTNFTMTTITKTKATSRLLQEDTVYDPTVTAVILTFDFDQGVKIRATSDVDLIVQVDIDELFGSYSNRRLLFQAEMAAALRTIQDDEQDSLLSFSDPNQIKKDAIHSLLRAVAKGTSEDPQDLEVQQLENVNLLRRSDGAYIIQEEQQSSRLLRALDNLRGLQEWQGVFDEIYDNTVVPKIEAVKAAINDIILDENVDVDNPEIKAALLNSNFAPDVVIDVVSEVPENSQTRLLQQIQESPSAPTSPSTPASSLTTQNAPSASSNTQVPKEKPDSKSQSKIDPNKKPESKSNSDPSSKPQSPKDDQTSQAAKRGGKKNGRRPLDGKKRSRSRSSGRRQRSGTTDEATANFALYCSGGAQNKTCATTVVNNPNSPIQVLKKESKNQGSQRRSTPKRRGVYSISRRNKDTKTATTASPKPPVVAPPAAPTQTTPSVTPTVPAATPTSSPTATTRADPSSTPSNSPQQTGPSPQPVQANP